MSSFATLRFLYCGEGDTILVTAADGANSTPRWGLIDCHLREWYGTYERLKEYLQSVDELEFACVTHPDQDHYYGLHRLLTERFLIPLDGKLSLKVREFWDQGIDSHGLVARFEEQAKWRQTRLLALAERPELSLPGLPEALLAVELNKLYKFLNPHFECGALKRWKAGPDAEARSFAQFRVYPLAPESYRVERFSARRHSQGARPDPNEISLILAFVHQPTGCVIMFGGDAVAEAWTEALKVWERRKMTLTQLEKVPNDKISILKVSHHGARNSHCVELYRKHCLPGRSVAVISAEYGNAHHPSKETRDALARYGVKIATTCRLPQRIAKHLILAGKVEDHGQRFDVEISLHTDKRRQIQVRYRRV